MDVPGLVTVDDTTVLRKGRSDQGPELHSDRQAQYRAAGR